MIFNIMIEKQDIMPPVFHFLPNEGIILYQNPAPDYSHKRDNFFLNKSAGVIEYPYGETTQHVQRMLMTAPSVPPHKMPEAPAVVSPYCQLTFILIALFPPRRTPRSLNESELILKA